MNAHGEKSFAKHFQARRSSPLDAAALPEPAFAEVTGAGEKWLFRGIGGEEPMLVRAAAGALVRNIVTGVTGALLVVGSGGAPGEGARPTTRRAVLGS